MNGMVERLQECLDGYGIAVEVGAASSAESDVHRAVIRLGRGNSAQDYELLFGPAVRFADVSRAIAPLTPVLVFTTFISARTADAFRRAEVQYLDVAGNAWIRFGDVLVDVRGRPRPDRTDQTPQQATGNLFSTGRAQVAFALLAWPQLWQAPRRDLAHAARVSVGQAHNTLALLAEAGYAGERERLGQPSLLDLWAAAFATGLAKRLALATWRGEIDHPRKVNPDDPMFISGESAVPDLLRPATLTLYADDLDPRLPVVNKWRTDGPANIFLRRRFWNAPDNSDAPLAGWRNAPWPLVYADLLTSDDPRVRSAAADWKARFAGPHQDS
jgi:hypothetical protein